MIGSGEPDSVSLMPQIDPRHASQMNIQDQTGRLGLRIAIEECFGRHEHPRGKAVGVQQPLDRLQHRRLVIDHRDDLVPIRHEAMSAFSPE